jgi:hypothetical protein
MIRQFNGISSINITQKVLGKAYGESSSSSFPFRLDIDVVVVVVATKTVGSLYYIYTLGIISLSTDIFSALTSNVSNGCDPTFRITGLRTTTLATFWTRPWRVSI